jgi:hypothetical protein
MTCWSTWVTYPMGLYETFYMKIVTTLNLQFSVTSTNYVPTPGYLGLIDPDKLAGVISFARETLGGYQIGGGPSNH